MKNSTDEFDGHGGNVQAGDNVKILFGEQEGRFGKVTLVRHQGRKQTLVVKLDQGETITVAPHQVSHTSSPN